MTASSKAALLFAALALALFAAGSWNLAEAAKQRAAQRGNITTEHRIVRSSRIYHYATVTPELLCPRRPVGKWMRWAIAQQADGGKWVIKCAY